MTVYSSASRQQAYDALLKQRRGRRITGEEFQRKKAAIDRREEKSVAYFEAKRDRKAREAEARREAKKAATRAKREAVKAEKKAISAIPSNLLEFRVKIGEEVGGKSREDAIREIWKRTKGSTIRVMADKEYQTGLDTFSRFDKLITVRGKDNGYKEFRAAFIAGGSDGGWYIFSGDTLLVMRSNDINPVRLIQRFRDGISHCVFTPIISKLSTKDGSASYIKKQAQRLKAVMKLAGLYRNGVPEDKMDEVARAAGMKIVLFDVFGNELAVYNEKSMGAVIKMTNTRENHVDIGLVVDSDPVEMNQEEMNRLWAETKRLELFYMVDGDFMNGDARRLRTLKGSWCVADPVADACKAFDKELGIMNYKINARKQPLLNDFLKAGRIVNGWSCKLGDSEATACADMPSAYAQFKKCHMYRGFLGHIHQFRHFWDKKFDREFVEEHLGYYEVQLMGGITPLMEKLGMYIGQRLVLFSPELLYFMNDGLQVDITQGAWGSRFDFEFSEDMMKDRKYCIWSGRLGMEREETSHTIPCNSSEWASHLATEHKVFYWADSKLLTIKKPAKNVFTGHHILGAITAYTRIQMMEAMKQFEPSQLVRVVMDGIYYHGEKPTGLDWFKDKKVVKDDGYSGGWYVDQDELPIFAPMQRIVRDTLLIGQGGSGKTYSIFNDPGFNSVLFVSPSHILGQDVRNKYNAKYTTIHKLIGIECCPYYKEQRVPPVILVDEITQLPGEWIDEVFEMYPESLILLAGDIDVEGRWFQCRSGNGDNWNEIWKPTSIVDVVEFTEDRRSRDEALKKLKLVIRDAMRACDLEGGATYQMEDWARKNLPVSTMDFQPGDTCIAGTHRTNQKLLDRGIVSGWYKKGGYVSDVELPRYEKRGSFTTHSYQGKTIESGRVWVCIDDMFEYAMLYTAISRAVSFDQIRFFRSRDL
jgi:hypothetical protein